jgi:proline dehydrogenase
LLEEAVIHTSKPSPKVSQRFGTLLSTLLAPFARRFIAGTTLAEALAVAARLKAQGFHTTVDHLGEDVGRAEEARIAAEQYVVLLHALRERSLDRNVSLKLSQLGLAIDPALCHENLARIVHAAEEVGGFVRLDMEGSAFTQATLNCAMQVKRYRSVPVGAALQAMLHRTPEDMVALIGREIPIRLCKGAYKEPPSLALQNMREIRRQFAALSKRLLTSGLFHGIATHDPALIEEVAAFAKSQGIGADRFEFQMLLGIRRQLARRLLAEGWRVRIYVPFGRYWLPYTLRRVREKRENAWFVLKSLFIR